MARTRSLAIAGSLLAAAILLTVATTAAQAFSAQLLRHPYLTDAVAGGVTVNWGTDRSQATGSLRWGVAGRESCTAHMVPATRRTVNVNGVLEYQWTARIPLEPDTRFCYRVFGGSVDLLADDPSPQSVTQLPAGSAAPFSFLVFGDWGQGRAAGNPHQAALMRQMAASGARFGLSTGDTGYPSGSQANYGDLVQTGDNISGVFGPDAWTVVGHELPMFSAIGNHGFNATFLSLWPMANAASSSGGTYASETYCCTNGTSSASYPSAWYAFDQGNARFYVLEAAWSDLNRGTATAYQNDHDNHWTPGSAEYRWLENDLATHPAQLKFAVWHYPMYVDNPTEPSDTFLQGPDSLEGLLNRYGVDLGFAGHAHVYQRNNATPGGLVTYVTGGGGADVEPVVNCSAIDAYAIGWSDSHARGSACGAATPPTSADEVFHFLLVTVDGTHVTVRPTDSTGRVFDAQSYDFSDRPAGAPPPPATTPAGPAPGTPVPGSPGPAAPGPPTPSTSGSSTAAGRRIATALAARLRRVAAKRARRGRAGGRQAPRIVDGRLTTAAGRPLARRAVRLQIRPRIARSRWKTLKSASTDAQGRVSFTLPRSPSLYVRLLFAQTATLAGAQSAQVETRVRDRSTITVNRRTARNGQTARFSGRVLGGFVPKRGRRVELQRYDSARRRWVRVPTGILVTDSKGRWHGTYRFPTFLHRQAVKFRLRMPTRGDVPFAAGVSRTVSVTVAGSR